MGYLESVVYTVVPLDTFRILRACSGCGCQSEYRCTDKVRINACGKRLDVWLIYQCAKCAHTYNLPVYSRISRSALDKDEYQALSRSDEAVVRRYALDRSLFQKNGAMIADEPPYRLEKTDLPAVEGVFRFINPFGLRLRPERLLAEALSVSRTEAKRLIDGEGVSVSKGVGEICVTFAETQSR